MATAADTFAPKATTNNVGRISQVIGAVVDSVGAARAGERVTVGVFAEDVPVRVTVVADSLSGGIVELGGV